MSAATVIALQAAACHCGTAIRQKANEANHEILLMGEKDARNIIRFSEMLLRFICEMPNL